MSEEEFLTRYKALNAEQRRAVDTIDGPVMVIAGPGTGKTTILTLRIANILRQTDTPASGILALTYSNAGARAMREKLREVIGNRAHEIYIHTFHSFAASMMSEYPDHFLEIRDFRQMSDVEGESLIRDILTDPQFRILRPLGRTDFYIGPILKAISDAKKDAFTPAMVREFVTKEMDVVKNDESNISTRGKSKGELKAVALEELEKLHKTLLFSDIYEQYEDRKRKLKLQDYNDLILNFLVALHNDTLLLRLIQERFLYLLVDEHQDTNDAQNNIISFIAEFFETPNIFIVGDEKQAIYRFQGASVENFLRLSQRWPTMQKISLSENYRSHQSLLDATFAMIENNYSGEEYADLRVKLKAKGSETSRPIDIIVGKNTPAIERYLISELRRIQEEEPEASVAIITRWNRDLERVLHILESAEIPVSSERSVDIFHHPIGVVFFHVIEYLLDPSLIHALSRTLAAGLWGLDIHTSIETITALKRGDEMYVRNQLPALESVRALLLQDGAMKGLIQTAELSGFTALVARDPAFVHVWRGIVTLAESLVREGKLINPRELFENLLAYRQSAEEKSVKVSIGAPDLPIKAMTAHGSKGLEFEYVFIPYAQDEGWIGGARGTSFILPARQLAGGPKKQTHDHDVADMRRLFYVALTRAKKHAAILYAETEANGEALSPLRFVNELHSEHIGIHHLPLADVFADTHTRSITGEYETHVVERAKEILLESGLSVTALNHFIECPSKFLYESILRLPQAPSISIEKGNAMHEAISRVWHSADRSKEYIESTIISTVTEYIDGSLLSTHDKEALKKELIDNAPKVAAALQDHFKTDKDIAAERWVQAFFETTYEGEGIRIPIHGKLDLMLSDIDHVDVYDYKTRQGMSENEIKGTRPSDKDNPRAGEYFRQLVYYIMLLRDNNSPVGLQRKSATASLVFVQPNDMGRCPIVTVPVTDEDIQKVEGEIKKVIENVWSGQIAHEYCDDKDCEYCGYRRLMK